MCIIHPKPEQPSDDPPPTELPPAPLDAVLVPGSRVNLHSVSLAPSCDGLPSFCDIAEMRVCPMFLRHVPFQRLHEHCPFQLGGLGYGL